MGLQGLTASQFGRLKVRDPHYYTGRWPYLSRAVQMVMADGAPDSALELGPYRRPLFEGSDVMDLHDYLADDSSAKVKWVCDARKVPWVIGDKAYDLFVALQVWEHLGSDQAKAFAEVRRVAQRAVLSFPYLWQMKDTSNCHHNVDLKRILAWTDGAQPKQRVIIDKPDHRFKRMVCYYDFRT